MGLLVLAGYCIAFYFLTLTLKVIPVLQDEAYLMKMQIFDMIEVRNRFLQYHAVGEMTVDSGPFKNEWVVPLTAIFCPLATVILCRFQLC